MQENYKILKDKIDSLEFECYYDEKILGLTLHYERLRKFLVYFMWLSIIGIIAAAASVMIFVYGSERFVYIILIVLYGIFLFFFVRNRTEKINSALLNVTLSFLGDFHYADKYTRASIKSYIKSISTLPEYEKCFCSNCFTASYNGLDIKISNISLYKKVITIVENEKIFHEECVFSGMVIIINNAKKSNWGQVIIKNPNYDYCEPKKLQRLIKMKILENEEFSCCYDIYTDIKESAKNIITERLINNLKYMIKADIYEGDIAISFENGDNINAVLCNCNQISLSIFNCLTNISLYKQILHEFCSYLAIIDGITETEE